MGRSPPLDVPGSREGAQPSEHPRARRAHRVRSQARYGAGSRTVGKPLSTYTLPSGVSTVSKIRSCPKGSFSMRRRILVVSLPLVVAALAVFASSAGAATIWPSTAVPKVANDSDTRAVELGLKFQSDLGGSITGIRYYKSTANTGTHIGSLWSSAGSQLGSATFSGETASGWQQVDFADPVGITANTQYRASYHTNVGHYAADDKFFATTGVDNPPLHALKNGVSGPNGVYRYAANSMFPNTGSVAANSWVDAVFSDAPGLTDRSPAASATNVPRTAAATATFSES